MPDSDATVLITGDSGAIGGATVDLFIERGWHVVGVDVASAPRRHPSHSKIVADLTDERALSSELGLLDGLPPLLHIVAVAGGALDVEPATQGDPLLIDVEDFRLSLDRNLTSQFITMKSALPWLRSNPSHDRSVTFTSSFNALATQGMPAYSAAKAGLIGMMNALVRPLGREGIRVNTVAPGTVRTPRTERIWSEAAGHFEQLAGSAALGRLGEPEDVARVFRSLAVEMTHVTGQVILVDGGQMGSPG